MSERAWVPSGTISTFRNLTSIHVTWLQGLNTIGNMAEICWDVWLSECTSTDSRSPDEGTTRNPLSLHLRMQATFMPLSQWRKSHTRIQTYSSFFKQFLQRLALSLETFQHVLHLFVIGSRLLCHVLSPISQYVWASQSGTHWWSSILWIVVIFVFLLLQSVRTTTAAQSSVDNGQSQIMPSKAVQCRYSCHILKDCLWPLSRSWKFAAVVPIELHK